MAYPPNNTTPLLVPTMCHLTKIENHPAFSPKIKIKKKFKALQNREALVANEASTAMSIARLANLQHLEISTGSSPNCRTDSFQTIQERGFGARLLLVRNLIWRSWRGKREGRVETCMGVESG
jgi:hypothetical protein